LEPTDKVKQRPLITKYINNYTSKNTMDYFIHKDLGGFLQRELDFYIKNEIMRLDDIEHADEANYARLLKQIKTLRGVAKDIIQFLAQLENFQKKLWLKKKFVTETQYCITIDLLADYPDLLKTVLSNEAQREEWEKLFSVDLKKLDQLIGQGLDAVISNEKFKYLLLDTKFFDLCFKDEVVAELELLEKYCNGVLINSDNFQALSLIQEKFLKKITGVYADPPYNAKSSEIIYKNSYKHSSWISLMSDRIELAMNLKSKNGALITAIDENEQVNLSQLLNHKYPLHEHDCLSIVHNPAGVQGDNFSYSHENVIYTYEKQKGLIGKTERDEVSEEAFRDWGGTSSRSLAKNCFYPIVVKDNRIIRFGDVCEDDFHPESSNIRKGDEIWVYPVADDGEERKWVFARDSVEKIMHELKVKERNGVVSISRTKTTTSYKTVWSGNEYYANIYGSKLLNNIIGAKAFDFPKSIFTVQECLYALEEVRDKDSIVLDYFAGSGTTGHAVININRKDGGNRKYILCEMGRYFDTVTKPRVQKVIYAESWKSGKPIFDMDGKAGGVSQCFKYLRLEQYEDTLNNLSDSRTFNPESVPKDFMLSYLLDAETAESPSLLNLEQFSHPRQYKLKIKRPNSDQSSPQVIDLVETFNWLIGLHVEKLDKWRAYDCEFQREHDPELPQDQNTRLKVTNMKQANAYVDDAPVYQIRTVEGWVRQVPGNDDLRDKVLVIWRNLSDDPEKDSAFLEALLDKWKINQSDSQFDKIYINGPHGLQLRGSAKTRLLSLEDTFMTKMWEDA